MTDTMKQDETTRAEKFVVRFPPGMRDRIAQAATHSHRSMNAEIVARLQRSMVEWPGDLPRTEGCVPQGLEEGLLLDCFRRLPAEKRQALLALLV